MILAHDLKGVVAVGLCILHQVNLSLLTISYKMEVLKLLYVKFVGFVIFFQAETLFDIDLNVCLLFEFYVLDKQNPLLIKIQVELKVIDVHFSTLEQQLVVVICLLINIFHNLVNWLQ